jgi:hypothetical protein
MQQHLMTAGALDQCLLVAPPRKVREPYLICQTIQCAAGGGNRCCRCRRDCTSHCFLTHNVLMPFAGSASPVSGGSCRLVQIGSTGKQAAGTCCCCCCCCCRGCFRHTMLLFSLSAGSVSPVPGGSRRMTRVGSTADKLPAAAGAAGAGAVRSTSPQSNARSGEA